ncbi:hypothetical protein [Gellertiella hungarica]|uniref:Uncharacterized protein n=1 Tax=Gellertiella hungarica TaxID=1572859 RepID=A0A7W6NMA5_9HYPH|nr:hypothetical protein [Gellertiella hungarica]MBB4066743.1 hypothetical protein [Gellertiella hungarica]
MAKLTDLPEIDSVVDADYFYIFDMSSPASPDRKTPFSKLRPPGIRITGYMRYEGNITIPALAAGAEGTATIAVAGAALGDHVVFNLRAVNPAGVAISGCAVTADGVVSVVFRNHAAGAYAGAAVACMALVIRSAA